MSYERDNDVPQWQHVPLQVPWFSNDEVPVKEPAPLTNFSIGEEISPSVPVAIRWSSPGLAKYRRCALAVLTSNLVLSIWSVEGKLEEESSWNRRLLINHTLTDYFAGSEEDESSQVSSNLEEQTRLRTRIRSFAWAPSLPRATKTLGTQISFERQYLAITNDDNQVVLLAVDSPTSTLGSLQTWTATALTHVTIQPAQEYAFRDSTYFDDLMQQQRHISCISWSPWILQGEYYQSVITYTTNEGVRGRLVTCTDDVIQLGTEIPYTDTSLRHSGSMSWNPEVDDENHLTLAIFSSSGLDYLTISSIDASIVGKAEHDLDGRWDEISGTVWDHESDRLTRLHFSSLLSTVQSPSAVLERSPDGMKSFKSPNWKERIENSVVLFSVKNDLKGHGKTKVWGLTSSPLGDFIATCNSLHPSDSIEYGPPADRRGTVALSTLRQYSKMRESFPSRDTSAEGILFTVKKLMENTVEDAEQIPDFAEEVVDKLLLAYKPAEASNENTLSITSDDDMKELVSAIKIHAMFNRETLRDRYSILISYASNDTSSNEVARALISYRLARTLQKLSPTLSEVAFSKEILWHHRQLLVIIDGLFLSAEVEIDAEAARAGEVVASTDQCDFCTAPIPFTDLTTATCLNGHEFPRCGVSLVAIQAPGITKYCGICSTPFLNEEFVRAQEVADEADTEPPVTLARVLFQACDVCIFCGGKFVG